MIIFFLLYTVSILIVLFGTIFLVKYIRVDQYCEKSSININLSIIIAIKNEEENLPSLFDSIKNLDYSTDKYEVIFVDDNSNDNSNDLIRVFAAGKPHIKLIKAVDKGLPAKKGALTIGINNSQFENILITDGDCIIPSQWLNIFSKYFNSKGEIFFGKAPFYNDKSFINYLVCFENLRSYLLTFSLSNAGLPYSAAARNFGFKKSVWEKLKGYKNTTETVSGDDDLLIREAVKNNIKIIPIMEKEATVYSTAPLRFDEYLKQKSRHLSTSHFYLWKHKWLLAFWHSANIFLLGSIFLVPLSIFFIFPFLLKIAIDIITVLNTKKDLNYDFCPGQIVLFQILYEFVLILGFVLSIFNKKKW